MHIPYVQNKVRQLVVEQLHGMLDVPLSVGNIEVTWLHRLIVDDLYLADQKNQPMLAVDRLAGDLDLYPLLVNKQIALNTVRLYGLDLHLSKETPVSPLNCQFVLDAFASKDTLKKKSIFNLIFRSIQIRKGQFYYDVKNKPIKEKHFDTSHIGIQDLSGRISIKALKNDSLLAELKDLTLKERSGIEIKNMKFMAVGNLDSIKVKDFSLVMPHTLLNIKKAALTHLQQDSNKVDLGKAFVYLDITPSQIGLKDICPFIPALANFTDILRLKAKASGTIDHIVLDKLSLYRKDRFNFNGEMDLMHITNPDSTSLDGSVTDLTFTSEGVRWLVNNFSAKDLELPKPVLRLGDVNFKGNIKGQLANLNATGQLVTDVGGVNADLHFGKNLEGTTFLRGHVYSVGVDLHSLLEPKNPFGRVSFDLLLDMMRNKGQTFIGDVMGKVYGFDYKNYSYSDLTLMLNYRDDGINGQLQLDDPNGQLMVDGLFVNKGPHSLVNFIVNVSHFRPDRLNLTQKYVNPDFSGNIEANFEGNHVDNMIGTIELKELDFKTDLDSFYVKSLQVKAGGKGEERSLLVKSDLLNGAVEGNYSFARIVPNAMRTLSHYVPALLHTKAKMPITDNSFSFIFDINDIQDIAHTLQLPISINKPGQIKGYYNEQHSKVDLTADFPSLRLGKGKYENLRVECQNREDQLEANIVVTKLDVKKHRDNTLGIQASVKDDKLMANLDWSNSNKEHEFKGKFSGSAVFVREKDEKGKESLRTEVNIDRTPFVINDSIWHVAPSAITIQGTNYLVDHFKISSRGRYLSLNGIVSKDDPEAQLEVDLNKIQLAYVFDILGIPILQFSGEATGSIKASDLFGERIITSLLIANHFGFNQAEVGRLELNAQWVDDIGGILMMGSIYNDKGVWSDVNGYVYPVGKNSGLSLYFDAHDMNIRIAQPFVQNILKDIKGTGTGKIHLYGQPFSQITVDGDIAIKGGGAGIDFTQTYYNFDDTIHLKPDDIQLNGFKIRDA
ncbi:MAG: translocation/assembly module TamB, partial [Massilibacteroides sp.]|nr:translocation/assembly module TamB [Massilibacteroides sp.]